MINITSTVIFVIFIFYIIRSKYIRDHRENTPLKREGEKKEPQRIKFRKILQKNQYYSSPIKGAKSDIDIAINHVLKISELYLKDEKTKFTGYTELAVIKFKKQYKFEFPHAYIQFLRYLAPGEITIYDSQNYSIEGLETLNDSFSVFLEYIRYDPAQLENKFVFSGWLGYEFYLFDIDNSQDPKVYYLTYDEHEEELYWYEYPTFSKWLLNLTYNSLEVNLQIVTMNDENEKMALLKQGLDETKELMRIIN
ncbi:hypothetical protein BAZ10_15120 [Elizabethkingia occulta]|uniref:Knr4/Smi1-like domain-containing protein n=1 Tax=Elizabethkingia occulta TaxID=1867263 RepID=A0A1T3MTG5_9FLAO|nr:hypothetical protein BAZ10_15120 [Elizabethkingia occulta]